MHLFRPKSINHASRAAASRARRPRGQKPGLEALEGRQLLSLGSEFLANTTLRNAQLESDNASAPGGTSVAVWTDTFSNTDRDIRAQMFSSGGSRLGPELLVEGSIADARSPSVAMDDSGDFVVTWQQTVNGQTDVLAQRFSSTGAKLGGVIQVANSPKNEYDADAAMDAAGNFVVSYTQDFSATDQDVHARRFSRLGAPLGTIFVARGFNVDETASSVAMSSGGRFVVAYQTKVGSFGENIRMGRYNAAGTLEADLSIAGSSSPEQNPSVALDNFGNAVVAYQKLVGAGSDIKARRVIASGGVSAEINIRNSSVQEFTPAVAMRRDGGLSFVVAYNTNTPGSTVQATEVNASNTIVGQHNLTGIVSGPALSFDGDGDYLLTYTGVTGNNDANIHLRRGRLS